MILFQNSGMSRSYRKHFERIAKDRKTFQQRLAAFLDDRYGASHLLKPVLDGEPFAFVTNGDDKDLQFAWARERGLPASTTLESVLLAQIEEHRAEVFYNLDPITYDGPFARKLPSCVKKRICWRAAPTSGANFVGYDLVLCNFPSIIESWKRKGLRAAYLAPAHDERMDTFAATDDRPIDVVFVGGYSRHHSRRAEVLEYVAELADGYTIRFCLDESRLTTLAESAIGRLPRLNRFARPMSVRRVAQTPVFGTQLYRLLSSSKIVLNGAIDMAGKDRGNMRCFEALGCGALMVSDEGNYPDGFVAGETMLTYDSPASARKEISAALQEWPRFRQIAAQGRDMVRGMYSKESQWQRFQALIDEDR